MAKEQFKVGKWDIVLGYIVQFFLYCTNIIVLPYILSSVEDSTLGIWYIFISVSTFAQLMDFGFSASLSRNISFVFSGAKTIVRDGNPPKTEDGSINYNLLFSLISTSKKTYGVIALIILFILTLPGSVYINYVSKSANIDDIYLLWLFFSIAIAINYYLGYIVIFVRGRGNISLYNGLILVSKLSYAFLIYLLLYLDWGLWALVVAQTASSFIMILVGHWSFWDKDLKKERDADKNNFHQNLFPTIWYNAKKYGLTVITSYGFSHASVLIGGVFLLASEVARLGLILQICNIIASLSRVHLNTVYPKISSLWMSNDVGKIKQLFIKSQLISYSTWFCGFFVVIVYGDEILNYMHSKTTLPSTVIIVLYAFFYLMELTHGNCSMLISSKNSVPFFKAAITASLVSLIMMLLFLNLNLGLLAFPLANIIANVPYNSWKWVYEASKLLNEKKLEFNNISIL